MNENQTDTSDGDGFVTSMLKDEGVQRAAAGVVVAIIIAGVKKALFASA
jgi:hypothetical protein